MRKKTKKTIKPPSRLLDLLRTALIDRLSPGTIPMQPNYAKIDAVIAERGKEDFEALIDDLVRQCVIFDARFLVRAQYMAARMLFYWDRDSCSHPDQSIPDSLATEILPRLQAIEKHLLELAETYSTFKHTMGLAREDHVIRDSARKPRKTLRVVGQLARDVG